MQLTIKRIAGILQASIKLDGITVIAGQNNTGKSSVSKALWCALSILDNPAKRVEHERQATYERLLERAISHDTSFRRVQYTYNDVQNVAHNLAALSANGPLSGSDVNHELATFLPSIAEVLDYEDSYQDGSSLADALLEYSSVPAKEIEKTLFGNMLGEEFFGKVKNVDQFAAGTITLSFGRGRLRSRIANNEVEELVLDDGPGASAIYIDDPLILDRLSQPFTRMRSDRFLPLGNHQAQLCRLLIPRPQRAGDALDSILVEEKLGQVIASLDSTVDGFIARGRDRGLVYRRPGHRNDLDLRNISTGMKSFAIIKTLIREGKIREGDVLILDEPEVHLHPTWQLKYAELIVLLYKEYNLRILLATHSPYFLRAVEVYASHHEVADKCRYYHALGDEDGSIFQDVTYATEEIYEDMSIPFRILDELMPEE
ncbi:MAG: ATP-binding protein [Atopobiaceae bacterium]|nr:ATP-binding protein [Atopobiaceae bacterium]